MWLSNNIDPRVDDVLDFCRECVSDGVAVRPDRKSKVGNGRTRMQGGRMILEIGVKLPFLQQAWSDDDLVALCVTAGHELRHLEQRGQARFNAEIGSLPLSVDACASYLACIRNQVWYGRRNSKTAVCEVDAERGGIVYGRYMLGAICKVDDANDRIISYCNNQVREGDKLVAQAKNKKRDDISAANAGYYLQEKDCVAFPMGSLADIALAFSRAMSRVGSYQPLYDDDPITYPRGDEFFDTMRRGRVEGDDCLMKFRMVNKVVDRSAEYGLVDGMTCLALYMHPEFMESIPIDLSGITPEAVFDSSFADTPEQMIAHRDEVRNKKVGIVQLVRGVVKWFARLWPHEEQQACSEAKVQEDTYEEATETAALEHQGDQGSKEASEFIKSEDLEPKSGEELVDPLGGGTLAGAALMAKAAQKYKLKPGGDAAKDERSVTDMQRSLDGATVSAAAYKKKHDGNDGPDGP